MGLEFSGNSWGISVATPGCQVNLGFGVVSGDLGPQKAFAEIASQTFHRSFLSRMS